MTPRSPTGYLVRLAGPAPLPTRYVAADHVRTLATLRPESAAVYPTRSEAAEIADVYAYAGAAEIVPWFRGVKP